jgi:hypothetical protein
LFFGAYGPVAQTAFHSVHKFNVTLVPRPPNSGRPQAPSPQCFTLSLLLGETVLLVLNAPTFQPFGMKRSLAFCFQRTSN